MNATKETGKGSFHGAHPTAIVEESKLGLSTTSAIIGNPSLLSRGGGEKGGGNNIPLIPTGSIKGKVFSHEGEEKNVLKDNNYRD